MSADITAIEQVLYRYCFAVDTGTPDDVAALFAETAVLDPTYTGGAKVHGRAAIRQWYVDYQKNTRAAVDHLRHVVSNPQIDLSGDTATAVCYLTANSLAKGSGQASWTAGAYRDRLVKEGGAWRFAERQIIVHYSRTFPQPAG
jgi:ketosteroid isomerase-like protein